MLKARPLTCREMVQLVTSYLEDELSLGDPRPLVPDQVGAGHELAARLGDQGVAKAQRVGGGEGDDAADFAERVQAVLAEVDVIAGGDQEFAAAGLSPDELAGQGRLLVIVKHGPDGASVGTAAGFVDVPGHERYVRTMVAGAWLRPRSPACSMTPMRRADGPPARFLPDQRLLAAHRRRGAESLPDRRHMTRRRSSGPIGW